MERGDDRAARPDTSWSRDEDPEPAWADAIRRARRARGVRLREIFAGFGDDEPGAGPPGPVAPDREDGRA